MPERHSSSSELFTHCADSANYRGIGLSSVYVKLFDYILLDRADRHRDKLITSDSLVAFQDRTRPSVTIS